MNLSVWRFSSLFRSLNPMRITPYMAAAFLLSTGPVSVVAQGTHVWTQSRFEELEKGTPDGVEITSDGKLRRGPAVAELGTTPSSFVWSVATSKGDKEAFLGTASPATVLRVKIDRVGSGPAKFEKIFDSKALAVQKVVVGPDGSLYAATLPDGKVYRLKADASGSVDESTAEVVFDLGKISTANAEISETKSENKARYIWDMTFDSAGRLYVATGGPGAIYRIEVAKSHAEPQLFFKTDEPHIRALAWDAKGNLIAGSDGSGLVYRISPEGKGYVLFSAPRREVTALAVGADGTIYESDVGDKSHNPLPALPLQNGGNSITITFVQPGSVQAANASAALPEGTEIFALKPDQAPRKLWSGKDDIVYKLAASEESLTALTGNRGRILTIHVDGSFSDVAHLNAQQAVAMAPVAGGWLVGTANTGKLFKLKTDTGKPDEHEYASDVLDAGAASRWGRIETEPGIKNVTLWTRSGNVEQPVRNEKDWGWSDWQPLSNDKIVSPLGRYLQWKVSLTEGGELSGVGVNYLPVNAAPWVDDVIVVPGARVMQQAAQAQPPQVQISFPNNGQNGGVAVDANATNAATPIQAQKERTAVTVRWNAHDDNGDDLSFDLYLRGDGEKVWRLLKKNVTDKVYSFDGSTLPDGGYHVRVVASDAPSHSPGEALTGEITSDRFELDLTAPLISGLSAEIDAHAPVKAADCRADGCEKERMVSVSFDAKDAISPISHAEVSVDAGPWQYIEPVGGLSDSKEEHYAISVPAKVLDAGQHLITVRAYDRHDNVAVAKVIIGSTAGAEKK
jgi:hypothetical protein